MRRTFQRFSNARGGIYHTCGGKTTTAARNSVSLVLIKSLKLNHLVAIFSAGTVLAQSNQRHAIKTTIEGVVEALSNQKKLEYQNPYFETNPNVQMMENFKQARFGFRI